MYHETVAEYEQVAPRHIADAYELLEPPSRDPNAPDASTRHIVGAVYLAGYAVECALKAYLITANGKADFTETITELKRRGISMSRGFAHDLVGLLNASDLDTSKNVRVAKNFGVCASWTPLLRYDPYVSRTETEAREFVDAAAALRRWVHKQRVARARS